jgi:hypothetical protein
MCSGLRNGGDVPMGEVIRVAVSVSAIILLAVVLIIMMRGGSLKAGPALVAMLFGFFLASTGASDEIQQFLNSLSDAIAALHF